MSHGFGAPFDDGGNADSASNCSCRALGGAIGSIADQVVGGIRTTISWLFNESDEAVDRLTGGLQQATDTKGRPAKGFYVSPGGNAQSDLDSLPGEVGANGQKILPDGSVAGVHDSTTTGVPSLHINRPSGKQDIKIRYPGGS